MSQDNVVTDSQSDSFEVLVPSCLGISAAAGFSTVVAFAPRGIGGSVRGLFLWCKVLSGGSCHVSCTDVTIIAPAQTVELLTSFSVTLA